jgi:hypothetical protein
MVQFCGKNSAVFLLTEWHERRDPYFFLKFIPEFLPQLVQT